MIIQNTNTRVAIVSFVILFTELLLIRLIGTEIRIFAYVPNLILLATFLGSGLGALIDRKIPILFSNLGIVLAVSLTTINIFKNITDYISPISDSFIWFQNSGNYVNYFFGVVLSIFLFVVVAAVFVPLGQTLAKLYDSSENLVVTYSINILFSLVGIITFTFFSVFSLSPYISIIFSLLLIGVLAKKEHLPFVIITTLLYLPLILSAMLSTSDIVWSPYQKLKITNLPANPILPQGKMLQVNNVGYMGILDLSKKYKATIPEKITNLDIEVDKNYISFGDQYELPYIFKDNPENVLIIGAGGGNDVAGALRRNAKKVTAVEIDPKIILFGKKYHPEKPYLKSNVEIVNTDGREFLKRTSEKYDIVVMGLTDSHTLNSNLTNVQLDNFLYTKESLNDIHKVLKEDGILFISFDVRRDWIGNRIYGSILNAFEIEPIIISMQGDPPIYGWGGVFYIVSKNKEYLNTVIESNDELAEFIEARKTKFNVPKKLLSDDWPYLYLESPRIPRIHWILSSILLLISFLVFNKVKGKNNLNLNAFLLGAAFLLYEFQNIGRTSVIFGNTWNTNIFIISTILFLILCANLVTIKTKISYKFIIVGLVTSFLLQLTIPIDFYLELSKTLKYTAAPILLNIPLFFAALIFIRLFDAEKDRRTFYASNLFGSALGGVLSFTSYLYGINSLIFVSFALYLIVLFRLIKK